MTDTKIFTEIGIGNDTFVSTEIETGDTETRRPGFAKMKLCGVYLRLWVGRTVWIVSTVNGFTRMTKPKRKFKLLLGFEGVPPSPSFPPRVVARGKLQRESRLNFQFGVAGSPFSRG